MSRSMNTPIGRSFVFFVVVLVGGDGDCDGSRDDEEAKNARQLQLQLLSLRR